VAYGSCSLTDAERKWSSTEKECFAVVHFMNLWWHLLLGAQFEVLTDHQALSKRFGQTESPTGKLARWVSKMQPFKPFNAKCWSGGNSDALSRELKTGQVATMQGCGSVGQVVQDVPGALGPTGTKESKAADNQDNYVTKWPKAIPLKDATAKSVAGALLLVISMWGPPAELLSDQGPEFVAELNSKLSRQWGIKRKYAIAYHPQTSRHVEQFNRMLKAIIAKFVNGRQDNWDIYLPAFFYAYKTSLHRSMGHTP